MSLTELPWHVVALQMYASGRPLSEIAAELERSVPSVRRHLILGIANVPAGAPDWWARAVKLCSAGSSPREIGRVVQQSADEVASALEVCGVLSLLPRQVRNRPVADPKTARKGSWHAVVARAFREGETIEEIVRIYGISRPTIMKYLLEEGLRPKLKPGPRKREKRERRGKPRPRMR